MTVTGGSDRTSGRRPEYRGAAARLRPIPRRVCPESIVSSPRSFQRPAGIPSGNFGL